MRRGTALAALTSEGIKITFFRIDLVYLVHLFRIDLSPLPDKSSFLQLRTFIATIGQLLRCEDPETEEQVPVSFRCGSLTGGGRIFSSQCAP